VLLPLLWALQLSADTLKVQTLDRPPLPNGPIETAHLDSPQVRLRTGQGDVLTWLLRALPAGFRGHDRSAENEDEKHLAHSRTRLHIPTRWSGKEQ
jgi:hypothetical protein